MLKKILFLLLIVENQIAAMSSLEVKTPQSTYLSTKETKPLSPSQKTYSSTIQSMPMGIFMAIGSIGIGINFGKFTTSHLLPTKTQRAIKTALFIAIASTVAVMMGQDEIVFFTEKYNNWRHKN